MAASESTHGLKEAVSLTTQAIDARAARFRNLVIVVVGVAIISMVWAVFRMSWQPLLALLILMPLCAAFLYLDIALVNHWQEQIVDMWVREFLDLDIFSDTMSSLRMLPSRTLKSMLCPLRNNQNALTSGQIPPVTRKALAMTLKTISRCQNDRTAFVAFAYILCCTFLALAGIRWSLPSLLGLLFVLPLIAAFKWTNDWRFRRLRKQIVGMKQEQGIELSNYVEVAAQLDWESIPHKKKDRLLSSLTNT